MDFRKTVGFGHRAASELVASPETTPTWWLDQQLARGGREKAGPTLLRAIKKWSIQRKTFSRVAEMFLHTLSQIEVQKAPASMIVHAINLCWYLVGRLGSLHYSRDDVCGVTQELCQATARLLRKMINELKQPANLSFATVVILDKKYTKEKLPMSIVRFMCTNLLLLVRHSSHLAAAEKRGRFLGIDQISHSVLELKVFAETNLVQWQSSTGYQCCAGGSNPAIQRLRSIVLAALVGQVAATLLCGLPLGNTTKQGQSPGNSTKTVDLNSLPLWMPGHWNLLSLFPKSPSTVTAPVSPILKILAPITARCCNNAIQLSPWCCDVTHKSALLQLFGVAAFSSPLHVFTNEEMINLSGAKTTNNTEWKKKSWLCTPASEGGALSLESWIQIIRTACPHFQERPELRTECLKHRACGGFSGTNQCGSRIILQDCIVPSVNLTEVSISGGGGSALLTHFLANFAACGQVFEHWILTASSDEARQNARSELEGWVDSVIGHIVGCHVLPANDSRHFRIFDSTIAATFSNEASTAVSAAAAIQFLWNTEISSAISFRGLYAEHLVANDPMLVLCTGNSHAKSKANKSFLQLSPTCKFLRQRAAAFAGSKSALGPAQIIPIQLTREALDANYLTSPWLVLANLLGHLAGRAQQHSVLNSILTICGPELLAVLWCEICSPAFASLIKFSRYGDGTMHRAFGAVTRDGCGQMFRDMTGMICFFFNLLSHAFTVFNDSTFEAGIPFDKSALAEIVRFGGDWIYWSLCMSCFLPANTMHAQAPAVIISSSSSGNSENDESRRSIRRCLRLIEERDLRLKFTHQFSEEVKKKFWSLSPHIIDAANQFFRRPASHSSVSELDLLNPVKAQQLAVAMRKASTNINSSNDGRNQTISGVCIAFEENNVLRRLLNELPQAIPFPLRAALMHVFVAEDRRRVEVDRIKYGIKVRRTHCLEDGYSQLMAKLRNPEDIPLLRARFHVELIDVHGRTEAGIDAGGVFKEFLELLIKQAFDPGLGLFRWTEGKAYLCPNPHATRLYSGGKNACLEAFRFLGRVLGKAIYEGITIQLPLAPFFLNNVLGRGNSLDDLKLLDAEHHRNLNMLLDMDNVEDAALVFCQDEDVLGEIITIDLIPNGRNIPVTNGNVVRYLHLIAYHRLVGSTKNVTSAFVEGLFDILERQWLGMFSSIEFQQIISGGATSLDVDDLKANVKLIGYEKDSRTLELLWEVLKGLSEEDQGRFLQFTTGSSRAPLLGFGSMNPPFSIRRYEGEGESSGIANYFVDIERLPAASTCFNLFKLPPYKNKSNLRTKLLAAIRSGAGFDLS